MEIGTFYVGARHSRSRSERIGIEQSGSTRDNCISLRGRQTLSVQKSTRHKGWDPSSWVSLRPNGLGLIKPNHYLDMLKAAWQNKDQAGFAWRILSRGVCDGCALGVSGFHDWTMEGPHLCTVRLNLLRLNTMPAMDPSRLRDVSSLRGLSGKDLRELGRLPYPMIRRKGEAGFSRTTWSDALDLAANYIRKSNKQDESAQRTSRPRIAFYLTSRGITNEVYYVAQKVARFLGTNNIDNAARICHAPSTLALKRSVGASASTCSYTDWLGTDLLVFVGSDVPNNQPVTTKYMYFAKKQGAKILVVNAYREPGLERYWIPSAAESALFGTRLADEFFMVQVGGDVAFFNGVAKHLLDTGAVDQEFIDGHTAEIAALRESLNEQSWEMLTHASGSSKEAMIQFAGHIAAATSAVFVWSMGITQHKHGVDNVRSLINIALLKGFVGREKCGLMPIRGHSGVQGGAEMGAYATAFPGGDPINDENAEKLEISWGFKPPTAPGLNAVTMVDAAARNELDVLYSIGGNFLETLPEPDYVRSALERIPMRIHHDIIVSPQMLAESGEVVLLLPATTRYEQPGGGTETTTERRILFSPEIPGRRIGEARCEWETMVDLAKRVSPDEADLINFGSAQDIRNEIARVVPLYAGIDALKEQGDQIQWGGTRLCDGWQFNTQDGRAHFAALTPCVDTIPEGWFRLSTRRGKQFNSMVQANRDPLTGANRESVFISSVDCERLDIRNGDKIILKSECGSMCGTAFWAQVTPGNVQVHWPEGNVLIQNGPHDESGVPDYNSLVTITKLVA
jgi:molybdopterin-dependent oxidoreductase alpha subunit